MSVKNSPTSWLLVETVWHLMPGMPSVFQVCLVFFKEFSVKKILPCKTIC